jgi:hypothetical protein
MVLIVILVALAALFFGIAFFAYREGEDGFMFGSAGIAILCLVGVLFTSIILSTVKHVTFTVDDKVAVTTQDSGHEYQIFTRDGNVYSDNDSFVFFKFNSSNVYAQLKKGHTYDCKVSGFRIPILSAKNNIISCTEISK